MGFLGQLPEESSRLILLLQHSCSNSSHNVESVVKSKSIVILEASLISLTPPPPHPTHSQRQATWIVHVLTLTELEFRFDLAHFTSTPITNN